MMNCVRAQPPLYAMHAVSLLLQHAAVLCDDADMYVHALKHTRVVGVSSWSSGPAGSGSSILNAAAAAVDRDGL